MDPCAAVRPADRAGRRGCFLNAEETQAHRSCVVMEPFPVQEITVSSAQWQHRTIEFLYRVRQGTLYKEEIALLLKIV